MTTASVTRFVQFAALMLLGAVICAIVAFAPSTARVEKVLPFEGVPNNAAVWNKSLAHSFPNCHNIDSRPKSVTPNEVVIIPLSGKAYREDFGFAWAHRKENLGTTVGYCL